MSYPIVIHDLQNRILTSQPVEYAFRTFDKKEYLYDFVNRGKLRLTHQLWQLEVHGFPISDPSENGSRTTSGGTWVNRCFDLILSTFGPKAKKENIQNYLKSSDTNLLVKINDPKRLLYDISQFLLEKRFIGWNGEKYIEKKALSWCSLAPVDYSGPQEPKDGISQFLYSVYGDKEPEPFSGDDEQRYLFTLNSQFGLEEMERMKKNHPTTVDVHNQSKAEFISNAHIQEARYLPYYYIDLNKKLDYVEVISIDDF